MENETTKTTALFLPNPDYKRLPIVGQCMGCSKVYENHGLPECEVLVDVCICYEDPEMKWNRYRLEQGSKKVSGKDEIIFYHYNPCPMATHIKHTPKVAEVRGRVKRK